MKNQLRFILSSYHTPQPSNPTNLQYLSPSQSMPKQEFGHSSDHITKRNSELKRMKERLNHLLKQTDQLCQKKKDLSQKIKSIGKSAEAIRKQQKESREEQIQSPIKKLYFSRSLTPKNQPKQKHFQFRTDLHQQTDKKLNSKPVDEKKYIETQEDASLGTGDEKSPLFEYPSQKAYLDENYGQKFEDAIKDESRNEIVEEKDKKRQIQQISKWRLTEVNALLADEQKIGLKEQIRELNGIREYYQKELLEEMKKREEDKRKYDEELKDLKDKYERAIEEYLNQIQKKEEKIEELIRKGVNHESFPHYEQLSSRVQQLQRQNQYNIHLISSQNLQIKHLNSVVTQYKQLISKLEIDQQPETLTSFSRGSPLSNDAIKQIVVSNLQKNKSSGVDQQKKEREKIVVVEKKVQRQLEQQDVGLLGFCGVEKEVSQNNEQGMQKMEQSEQNQIKEEDGMKGGGRI